jgi:hypothetical protein
MNCLAQRVADRKPVKSLPPPNESPVRSEREGTAPVAAPVSLLHEGMPPRIKICAHRGRTVQQFGDGAHSSGCSEGRDAKSVNVVIAKIVRDDEPIFSTVANR